MDKVEWQRVVFLGMMLAACIAAQALGSVELAVFLGGAAVGAAPGAIRRPGT